MAICSWDFPEVDCTIRVTLPFQIHPSMLGMGHTASDRLRWGQGVLDGFLLRARFNLDGTFEARSVFYRNLWSSQIPGHRAVLLDLNPALRAHVPLQVAAYNHVTRDDVRFHSGRRSEHQFLLFKLHDSLERTIDE